MSRSVRRPTTMIDNPRDGFNRLITTSLTPQLELKSTYGISLLRDRTTTTAGGAVSHPGAGSGAEFELTTSTGTTDAAVLETAERGRYQPGYEAEVGIAVRLASASVAGVARWGYFDDDNGLFFQLDSGGLAVVRRRKGSDTVVRQADWNWDRMDGSGSSGVTLDVTRGDIYQIEFTWYGYGVINFSVVTDSPTGQQKSFVVHRMTTESGTSIDDPNLPVRAELDNDGSSTAMSMFVAGRQYSVQGLYRPLFRTNSSFRLDLGSVGTTFVPLVSFRKKAAFTSANVLPKEFQLITTEDLVVQLRLGATLTGASWGTPENTSAGETACERDVSATALSGGEAIATSFAEGGQGNQTSTAAREIISNVPDDEAISLCVRSVSGTATVSGLLSWIEEW